MDANLEKIMEKRVERTLKNLVSNNMLATFVESKDQAVQKLSEYLRDGDTVTCGGSRTLFEAGIIPYLKSGRYHYLDRYQQGLSQEIYDVFRKAFTADVYVTSSNAVTENGELFNVDGNGNRVAAMLFGPKSVIVVAGVNKLVKDADEALARLRHTAAPANAVRLGLDTPCAALGYCTDCKSPHRICSDYVLMAHQEVKDRIKVILVGENLGY